MVYYPGPVEFEKATVASQTVTDQTVSSQTVTALTFAGAVPAGVTTAAAAGAANVAEVSYQVVDGNGDALAGVFILDVFLSDAATGLGLTATSASGTVTAKAASGAVIGTLTSKKALRVQTLATGIFILEITDTAKTAFYPCAVIPANGRMSVGTVLATASYGA
jgi:hypothetical protein